MTGGEEPGQIPRPGTASANCPNVLVRREDILLITRQGNRPGKWMSDQSIPIRVEDVDALIRGRPRSPGRTLDTLHRVALRLRRP
jgi:hypothetical protein